MKINKLDDLGTIPFDGKVLQTTILVSLPIKRK